MLPLSPRGRKPCESDVMSQEVRVRTSNLA
jgi:hypothetical protein